MTGFGKPPRPTEVLRDITLITAQKRKVKEADETGLSKTLRNCR